MKLLRNLNLLKDLNTDGKKFKIASDWTSDLMMYDLGKNKNNLEKLFPVEIDIVDLPDLKKSTKDASIYFGNRISEDIVKKNSEPRMGSFWIYRN